MPKYEYRAKDGPHRTVGGELLADSHSAAVARIDAMGYSPIWVREQTGDGSSKLGWRSGRLSQQDVTVFTYQLASMTRSHVPLLRALTTIRSQTENRRLQVTIGQIEKAVQDGMTLSESLARHPKIFPPLYVNMIRAGESAGCLDVVLTRLAESRARDEESRGRVQAATAYPALVVLVGAVTVFVLLAFFLPKVSSLFRDYDRLPVPTKILLGLSQFVSEYAYMILLLTMLAVVVLKRLATYAKGREFLDRIKLRIPVLGMLVRDADIVRFCRTLSLLLGAGVSIDRSLDLCLGVVRNSVLRQEVDGVRLNTVRQGNSLASGLARTLHFPPYVASMVTVGEEAGQLEEVLSEIALHYEMLMDRRSRMVTSLLEPALVLGIGGLVGFIVAAMLLPIFRLSTSL